MKWCCPGFEGNYRTAGQRGFAVLVGRDSQGSPAFWLQHRAIDEGVTLDCRDDVLISVVSETGMRFCPSCGKNLVQWYADAIDQLDPRGLRIGHDQ